MEKIAAPERDRGSFADVEGFPKADQSGKKGKVRRTQNLCIFIRDNHIFNTIICHAFDSTIETLP